MYTNRWSRPGPFPPKQVPDRAPNDPKSGHFKKSEPLGMAPPEVHPEADSFASAQARTLQACTPMPLPMPESCRKIFSTTGCTWVEEGRYVSQGWGATGIFSEDVPASAFPSQTAWRQPATHLPRAGPEAPRGGVRRPAAGEAS